MSEHTICLSPSEAFLVGLALGEWREYHDYVDGLHDIQRNVCGHMYESLPTFYEVLVKRFEPFVGNPGYFERTNEEINASVTWVNLTDNREVGVSSEHPLIVFHDRHHPAIESLPGFKLRAGRGKSILDQLLYILRGFAWMPYERAILFEIAASEELFANWSQVCELFASGNILREFPVRKDVPKHIEATLAPSLAGYNAEVDAGRCAGRLLASIELNRRELPDDADEWVENVQRGLDDWKDDRALLDLYTREELAEFARLIDEGTPESLQAIRNLPDPRPHLEDERPPIILGGSVNNKVNALLKHDIVRAFSHTWSFLEKCLKYDDLFAEIVWHDKWYDENDWTMDAMDDDDEGRDWVCGSYDDPAGQIIDPRGEYIRQNLHARELLIWAAIGALLGDMAKRDRAFSEDDARKVLPRNLTPFPIDDVGKLRGFLPTAQMLLAQGPSTRGDREAFVVKTLATSLEPIMKSAFPDDFKEQNGQVPQKLSHIIRTLSGNRRRLASTLLYLWNNFRNEAAHTGSERQYLHSEARAVFSLYELAMELHGGTA